MLVAMLGVPPSRKARPRLGLVALAFALAEVLGVDRRSLATTFAHVVSAAAAAMFIMRPDPGLASRALEGWSRRSRA